MKFNEINVNTLEGLLLTYAIGKLCATKEYYDRTPAELFNELELLRRLEQKVAPVEFPVELITTLGVFNVVMVADEAEYAASQVIEDAHRIPFRLEDGALLRIGKASQIVAAKVYPPMSVPNQEIFSENSQLSPFNTKPGDIHEWYEKVEYVGNKVDAEFYSVCINERVFILAYQVNGAPAAEVLSESGQASIIARWVTECFPWHDTAYKVVIPHGVLTDPEEAVNYLKDYVRETVAEIKPVERNARAFQDWKEKEAT